MTSKKQKEIVAKNLQNLLARKGKTQTDLAKDLGFPEMTVSNWTRAETYPRIDKIQLMADYFGIYRSDITEEKSEIIDEQTGTIAAHHDGENWTEEELEELDNFKKYLKSKRTN